VESGGRRPGLRPRPPHGPTAPGHDLPDDRETDDRGKNRRTAQPQTRPRRQPTRRRGCQRQDVGG